MSSGEIIPVLDLHRGTVVRGVAGVRSQYRPLVSQWTSAIDPLSIARMFQEQFGLESIYIADLDGLVDQTPQWELLNALAVQGFSMSVDIGIRTAADAQRLAETGIDRVIVALESLHSWEVLEEIISKLGTDRVTFSLDLMQGTPRAFSTLFPISSGQCIPQAARDFAMSIACRAIESGVTQMIVLDVAGVGVAGGIPTLTLCQMLRKEFSSLSLITGGGVRTLEDICTAHAAGVDAVLVASALHNGSMTPAAVRAFHGHRLVSPEDHGSISRIDSNPVDPAP